MRISSVKMQRRNCFSGCQKRKNICYHFSSTCNALLLNILYLRLVLGEVLKMVFVLCVSDGKKVRNLGHVSSEGSIFVYNSTRRPIKLRSDWEQLTVHNVTITDLQFYPHAKSTSITTVHQPPLALFFLPVILFCLNLPLQSIPHRKIQHYPG